MIGIESHTKEWLENTRRLLKGKDPILIEKVIKALTLLEQLKLKGLDFIFKGGSSLLLLLREINRFSIDIDIIIPSESRGLDELFKTIIAEGVFTGYEEDKRDNATTVPKAHFKFFYNSVSNIGKQNAVVLLDILFEPNPYPQTVSLPVESPFISTAPPLVKVTLPGVDCILGDKLTAFAPNTTGIPYGKGKSLEIIKQLYDIGKLFDHSDNIQIVKKTFEYIAGKELQYRHLPQTDVVQVLDDIFETAVIIAFRGTYKNDYFAELNEGIKKIIHFTYSEQYRIEDAIVSAGKAAYLSLLLKRLFNISTSEEIHRFNKKEDLSNLDIIHPDFTKFNKFKKYRPEAFFYWFQAIDLLGEKT
jgi:hypothetical protein